MTVRPRPAQHRSDRRARTPLTDLATSASTSASIIGRRTALFAASSGLLVSLMGAAPASASTAPSASTTVDLDALTTQARAALETAPAVTSTADATWSVELTTITVTPAPEPVPEPVVEPEPVRATTSRSAERSAVTSTVVTEAAPVIEAAPVAVPASASGSAIIDAASRYVGVPYVSGGSTPSGFDCSGFTSYVFAQVGISLPRTSSAQAGVGTIVSRADAQPGDLIYSPGHIAIYAGGNTQIDSPRPGKTIQFRDIWQADPVFIRVG
ncbi:C40 family peptidase [Sanguibacter antarcticus]|uniref:Cell wall-associated NlpC family hydrolase n=1 Tax=Sanguibacter antarcticus TaxID=372484 RepID=A0A2A9E8F1_9MICO|nr:C40 family peptidase [Sanguibacter antarcticus]PFG34926.1 cell wall-associated NlpC family hydrolase [Sanguibacter antarcticus]